MIHTPALTRAAAYFLPSRLGVRKTHRLPGQQEPSPKCGCTVTEAWETSIPEAFKF